jgi:hypothetical protein
MATFLLTFGSRTITGINYKAFCGTFKRIYKEGKKKSKETNKKKNEIMANERKKFRQFKYRGLLWLFSMCMLVISIVYSILQNPLSYFFLISGSSYWIIYIFYEIYYWIKSKPTKIEWRNASIWAIVYIMIGILVILVIRTL